jgi:hypothetical protein
MKTDTSQVSPELMIASQWRNFAYDKTGKSYRGKFIYNTQEEALAAIAELEAHIRTGEEFIICTNDSSMFPEDYSHAIPLPVE